MIKHIFSFWNRVLGLIMFSIGIMVVIFLKDIDMRDIDTYLDLFAMIFLLFCSICLFLLHISYDEKNMYVKYFCFCDTYSFDSILCLGIDYHLFKHPTVIYKNKKKNKIKTSFIGLLYPSKKKMKEFIKFIELEYPKIDLRSCKQEYR